MTKRHAVSLLDGGCSYNALSGSVARPLLRDSSPPYKEYWDSVLGGSGGLSKWVNKGDKWSYYMGYRGY